ncbi:MAG: penicillin acylase family protein [Spirochaetes bacterium]|nr:penicillin acylase family protein [Spirochaetota bacterium]
MRLRRSEVMLDGETGNIHIGRTKEGVPRVRAETAEGLAFGLGWVHANDRMLQMLLMRTVLQGRAAEQLRGDDRFIKLDTYMRRMNFVPDPERMLNGIEENVRRQLYRYAEGFNRFLSENGGPLATRLLCYKPKPWSVFDTLIIGKVFSFIGLTDIQGRMEKLIIQLIQKGIDETRLKDLFPSITERIDYDLIGRVKTVQTLVPETFEWMRDVPKFVASNNWALSGDHTRSKKPLICGDIHLQVNRLPAIWYEVVLQLSDNKLAGTTIPGSPGLIVGRTNHIAWSPTYTFMDMLDYRIEHCKDGRYRRPEGWREFSVREEVIRVKKKDPVRIRVYENEDGVLEGEPYEEGYYLLLCWSAAGDCGAEDFNAMMTLPGIRTAKDAMAQFRRLDVSSFNWAVTDTKGNIGLQMSGRCFDRKQGISGLIPVPAWLKGGGFGGWIAKKRLPSVYNPKEGFLCTANNDINDMGRSRPINLPMATYRADRIRMLLQGNKDITVEDMKKVQYDLYSVQAERYMKLIEPFIPDTKNGRILRGWDMRYDLGSVGAFLFESVYMTIMRTVFGNNGFGSEVFEFLVDETVFFHDYYGSMDDIVFNDKSSWWDGLDREAVLKSAVVQGLSVRATRYGKTRKMTFSHLLFGGRLPRFFGFDYGPVRLAGSRATIPQGQIHNSKTGALTVAPSFRMIADMSTDELHTNLAGGVSEKRFSRWYKSDIRRWLRGGYKVL